MLLFLTVLGGEGVNIGSVDLGGMDDWQLENA